jgi:hypothetical protein
LDGVALGLDAAATLKIHMRTNMKPLVRGGLDGVAPHLEGMEAATYLELHV